MPRLLLVLVRTFGCLRTSNLNARDASEITGLAERGRFVAATVACGGSGTLDNSETREPRADAVIVSIPSSEVDTPIVGGSAEQQAALREILAGIGPTSIERIEIEEPGPGWKPFDEDDVVVSFATKRGSKNLRGEWEAWLVGGIFRDTSDTGGLPGVLVVDTKGDAVRLGRRVLAEPLPPPDATPEAAQALAESVRQAVAESGAELVDLAILKPAGLAFAITLQTGQPAKFLSERVEPFLNLSERYEGAYVRVVDESGGIIWQAASASRMTMWAHGVTRPELRGCDPIPVFSFGPEDVPLPCPA